MPVPSSINDLSQTAGSNSPTGGEAPTTADDYLRTYASYIALHRDGKGFSAETDVASGATTDIGGANTFFVRITGTTTITSFGTNYNGPRFVRFGGALTLTHNSSTLILPGGANITTAAGDACVAVPIGNPASGWQVVAYQSAAGGGLIATTAEVQAGTNNTKIVTPAGLRAGLLVSGTSVNATGTSVDITGIPTWAKRIKVMVSGLSGNGTANLTFQLGDSGGIEATGYLGSVSSTTGANTSSVTLSTGFTLNPSGAGVTYHGAITFELLDASTFNWVATGVFGRTDTASNQVISGSKALSAALDRVRVTWSNGSDTFDAGVINYTYE